MNKQTKNLKPHKEAVIAMCLFGKEYADSGLGSMDYYDGLSTNKQRLCKTILEEIAQAPTQTTRN